MLFFQWHLSGGALEGAPRDTFSASPKSYTSWSLLEFAKGPRPAPCGYVHGHKKQSSKPSASCTERICESPNFFKLFCPQLSWAWGLGIFYCWSQPARSFSSLRWSSRPGKTITGKPPNHKPTSWCQTKDVTVRVSHRFWQVSSGEQRPSLAVKEIKVTRFIKE